MRPCSRHLLTHSFVCLSVSLSVFVFFIVCHLEDWFWLVKTVSCWTYPLWQRLPWTITSFYVSCLSVSVGGGYVVDENVTGPCNAAHMNLCVWVRRVCVAYACRIRKIWLCGFHNLFLLEVVFYSKVYSEDPCVYVNLQGYVWSYINVAVSRSCHNIYI